MYYFLPKIAMFRVIITNPSVYVYTKKFAPCCKKDDTYLSYGMSEKPTVEDPRVIERMFDSIAHRYDLLNRLLSFGNDVRWRKKLFRILHLQPGHKLLDLATGSGDILKEFLHTNHITGVGCDRSGQMLRFARKKLNRQELPSLLVRGDAFLLPFKDNSFDAVTIGFGIRNMRPRVIALKEIYRTIAPGGRLAVLEFFPRQRGLRGNLYSWYSKNVIPRVGKLISGSDFAYRYLPDSIRGFPEIEQFEEEMHTAGFTVDAIHRLTFGVVSIVVGRK
jgi:demethylmenaquinone methyltransferase / 2-methoxy-6-polyprenyl-1,4-benzoquinol methylase